MKARKFFAFSALFVLLCWGGVTGCNNVGGDGGGDNDKTVEAGWYKSTFDVGDASTTHYFYINSAGSIERAGDERTEFYGSELTKIQTTMNYKTCRDTANNSNGMVTFGRCTAPSWANYTGGDTENTFQLETKYKTVTVNTKVYCLYDLDDFNLNGEFQNVSGVDAYFGSDGNGKYLTFYETGTSTVKFFTNDIAGQSYVLYVFTIIGNNFGHDDGEDKLLGTWSLTSNSHTSSVTFNADGTGRFSLLYDGTFSWSLVSFSGTTANVNIFNSSETLMEKVYVCTFYDNFTEVYIPDLYVRQNFKKQE